VLVDTRTRLITPSDSRRHPCLSRTPCATASGVQDVRPVIGLLRRRGSQPSGFASLVLSTVRPCLGPTRRITALLLGRILVPARHRQRPICPHTRRHARKEARGTAHCHSKSPRERRDDRPLAHAPELPPPSEQPFLSARHRRAGTSRAGKRRPPTSMAGPRPCANNDLGRRDGAPYAAPSGGYTATDDLGYLPRRDRKIGLSARLWPSGCRGGVLISADLRGLAPNGCSVRPSAIQILRGEGAQPPWTAGSIGRGRRVRFRLPPPRISGELRVVPRRITRGLFRHLGPGGEEPAVSRPIDAFGATGGLQANPRRSDWCRRDAHEAISHETPHSRPRHQASSWPSTSISSSALAGVRSHASA
jgi:hypothetical protein